MDVLPTVKMAWSSPFCRSCRPSRSTCSSRPVGGVKDSCLGREGIRFAVEDMTEVRLMVLNRVGRRPE